MKILVSQLNSLGYLRRAGVSPQCVEAMAAIHISHNRHYAIGPTSPPFCQFLQLPNHPKLKVCWYWGAEFSGTFWGQDGQPLPTNHHETLYFQGPR